MASLTNSSAEARPIEFPYMDQLEDYTDMKQIGNGKYGVVYKAYRKATKESVALKEILIPDLKQGIPLTSLREIQILFQNPHENIVGLIDLCRVSVENPSRTRYFLVLEYCDYVLSKLIKNPQIRYNTEHIKSMMNQILDGLHFLHENKILHRDLKPENILIRETGIIKLADFGLSKILKPNENNLQRSPERKYVSLWYRAPELLKGSQVYDQAIDMWSLGCIFAELFTRTPVIPGDTEDSQYQLIIALHDSIKRPRNYQRYEHCSKYHNSIQEAFRTNLIDKLLEINPQQRLTCRQACESTVLKPILPIENFQSFLAKNRSFLGK